MSASTLPLLSRVTFRPWVTKADLEQMLVIEKASFTTPWSEIEFRDCWKRKECTTSVLELKGEVVAYIVYERSRNKIDIINLAVKPLYWRKGVGRWLVEKIIDKLHHSRQTKIHVLCSEYFTDAHFFWRKMGFLAIEVVRGLMDDEAAYRFEYELLMPDEIEQQREGGF